MIFSLINVSSRNNEGLVTGNWIQDVIGTIEEAHDRARSTEKVNGSNVTVAVVEGLPGTNPMLHGTFFKLTEIKPWKRCPKCFTVAEHILPCSCPS